MKWLSCRRFKLIMGSWLQLSSKGHGLAGLFEPTTTLTMWAGALRAPSTWVGAAAALLGVGIVGPVALACDRPSETHEVAAAIDEALEQYRELEIDAFKEEVNKARDHIDCLQTFLSRHHAAEYHRVEGIRLFVERNSPQAQKHFAAARVLEPNYSFPSDLVPEGNPLLEDYRALEPIPGSFDTLQRPRVGSIKLDGSSTLKRGTGRPVVFQLADGTGNVVLSKMVPGGQAVPEYESESATGANGTSKRPPKPPKPQKTKKNGGPNVPLLAVAGVAALAAGGMYGGAFATRSSWQSVPANSDQANKVDSARGLTNGLVVGSWVAGGVALGIGTTAFVVNGRF